MNYLVDLNNYRNLHSGSDVVIFTCGPSFNSYDEETIREFCKNKIVFTVKQSAKRYGDISDYHFFNDNNFIKYNCGAIKIASSANYEWAKNFVWGDQEIDIFMKIIKAGKDLKESISYTKDFQKILISEQSERIWGPGIMYETVLPFAIHIGAKNIYVNGWDYTVDSSGCLKHYYDESKAYGVLKNTGHKIGTMFSGEREVFIESTHYLKKFLDKLDINLYILSDVSSISNEFERVLL